MSNAPDGQRGMALVVVSLQALERFMQLPEGSVIESVHTQPHLPDRVYLRVTHPVFPQASPRKPFKRGSSGNSL